MAEKSPLLDEFAEKNTSLQDVLNSPDDLLCDIIPLSPDSCEDPTTPVHVANILETEELVECTIPTDTTDTCEEPLDPRIKGELDIMNASGDDINNLEAQLLRIKNDLTKIMTEGNIKLDDVKIKIGDRTIENAKIYYTTLIKAKKVHRSLLKATHDFDQANKDRQVAKDELKRVEEAFLTDKESIDRNTSEKTDVTKQQSMSLDCLNSAISRVNDLDEVVLKRENIHQLKSADFTRLVSTLQECKKKHRRNILKAKPYFEMKYHYEHRLRDLMATRRFIFEQLKQAKVRYNLAMHNLETISLQIHNVRGDLPDFESKNLANPLLLDGDGSIGSSSLGIAEIDPSIANQRSFTTGSLRSVDDVDELVEEVEQATITPAQKKKSRTTYGSRFAYL